MILSMNQIGSGSPGKKEAHVSDLEECPLILHFKEKCMILLKWCQCLHSILVITCSERERKNLEAICDNTAKFSFSSEESYCNY